MKSEKAKKYLDERANASYDNRLKVTQYDVRKAVELAEEDARERAGKAHCSTCLDNRYPRICQFQNRLDCSHLPNFIKNYDNYDNEE